MKRTRRVEVIRYSRRSTVGNEAGIEPDPIVEQAAIDALLGIPRLIEPPIEEINRAEQQLVGTSETGVVQKRRLLRFLRR